jgi:signal transduction histidine kinase
MKEKSIFNLIPSLSKDFILVYKSIICVIIVAGFLFIKFSIDQEKEKFQEILVASSEQINKVISSDLDYIKYQLSYSAGQIREINANEKKIDKLLSAFGTNNNNQVDVAVTWNAFSWINRKKLLSVDGAAGVLAHPVDMSGRDYLPETITNPGRLIFGKPVLGSLSQRLIVPAGMGVTAKEGSYLGTVVFGFDIEKILAKIEKTIDGESVSFVLVRNNMINFSSRNFRNENVVLIGKAEQRITKKEILEKTITSSANILSKENYFYSFQSMKDYPFDIIVLYDKEKSHQQIINLFFKQFLFLTMLVLSLIVMFRQIYRRVVKPLSQLSIFAVKTLEKDYAFRVEKPESKEFINLYSSLISLREAFKREEELLKEIECAHKKISLENFNKSEFLAAISHDVRNPLSAIISFAHMLHDNDDMAKEEVKEWSKDIENCAMEVLQFINDLMDVNQISSGEFSIDMSKRIDMSEIIRRSIRVNRDFARRKKIEIIQHAASESLLINLDSRRMKQILVNLISNAVKYSRDDVKIEVFAEKIYEDSMPKLRIIIKDRGFGMTEGQVKKAMEKYGTIKNENSGKVDSFGLGLPLVKNLVEAQKGKMMIDSTIGVGTVVTLVFNF